MIQKIANIILTILLLVAIVIIAVLLVEDKKRERAREKEFEQKIDSIVSYYEGREQIPQIIERERKVYITKRETVKVIEKVPVEIIRGNYLGIRDWQFLNWFHFRDSILFDFKQFYVATYYWADVEMMIFIDEWINTKDKKVKEYIYIYPQEPAKFMRIYFDREWVEKPSLFLNIGAMGKEPALGVSLNYKKLNAGLFISRKANLFSIGYRIK